MSPRSPGAAGGFLVSEDKCMQLFIGNRNYSSWSLRAWLVLRHFGIRFEERLMLLNGEGWKRKLRQVSPTGRVPVLVDGDLVIPETRSEEHTSELQSLMRISYD